ncbi:MAG: ferredoxin [Lachnospiraceae bacterium]
MDAYVNENCIGCGLCTGICPEVFSMTEDNVAVASGAPMAEQEMEMQEAAASCPVDAIEIES